MRLALKRLLPLAAMSIAGCSHHGEDTNPAKFAVLDEWSVRCPSYASLQYWRRNCIEIYLDDTSTQRVILVTVPYPKKLGALSFPSAEKDSTAFAKTLGASSVQNLISRDGRSHIHSTLLYGSKVFVSQAEWPKGLRAVTVDTFLGGKSRLYIVTFDFPNPGYKETAYNIVASTYSMGTEPSALKFQ